MLSGEKSGCDITCAATAGQSTAAPVQNSAVKIASLPPDAGIDANLDMARDLLQVTKHSIFVEGEEKRARARAAWRQSARLGCVTACHKVLDCSFEAW